MVKRKPWREEVGYTITTMTPCDAVLEEPHLEQREERGEKVAGFAVSVVARVVASAQWLEGPGGWFEM